MNKKYALIKDNKVTNIVMWDGESNWQPPKDCICIEHPDAEIGDDYIDQTIVKIDRTAKDNPPEEIE